jgi:hypothetical protein
MQWDSNISVELFLLEMEIQNTKYMNYNLIFLLQHVASYLIFIRFSPTITV